MGSRLKLLYATLCCLAFTVVHVHGELVLLQYPADANSRTQNYTCISNDEGAALTWTRPRKVTPVKDFEPKKPASGNVRDCGIRGDSTCLAKWHKTTDWRVVNSAEKPTGPVFDQRWEDFQEFESLPSGARRFRKVGVVNERSSTVWFSGQRPKGDGVGIFLCPREELSLGPCVVIAVDVSRSQTYVEAISFGPGTYDEYTRATLVGASTTIVNTRWFRDPNGDEWETLRLEWNTQQTTIKMFQGNNSEPFVQADMPSNWTQVSALGAYTYSTHPRLRIHFYDYYFTDTKNAVISTKGIEHSGKIFCAELLVGLCPKCKVNVTLVGEDGSGIQSWLFFGDGQDPYRGLLAWRLVKLDTRFESDIPRRLILKIKTGLDGDEGAGEWAIDNFRMCQPGKELRESTITLASGIGASCQKLSYAGSSIVKNPSSTSHDTEVLSELPEFLCPRKGPLVGRGGFICNPRGCICDRGFTGSRCEDECNDGSYGFRCMKTCGSCRNSKRCVKSTGFCEQGCRGNLIAPMCKTALVAPTVEDVGLTTATEVLQDVELDEDDGPIDIAIQIRESGGESWVNFTAKLRDSEISSSYEAHITGLKPNTVYTTRAVATVETTKLVPIVTFGPESNLTTCLDPAKSNLMVTPYGAHVTVRTRNAEGQNHSNLGQPYSVLVTDTFTNEVAFSASGTSLPFNVTYLMPFTEYQVKIVDTITRCTLLDTRFRTSESAPSEVRNLAVKSTSDTEVSLQWDPPAQENGIIRSYNVSVQLIELKGCRNLKKCTPPEEEIVKIVNETTVFFDGQHPYAKYVLSVAAQTSKPGSPVTLSLETNSTVIPTSMVSALRMSEDKGRVMWDEPADCTTITGPTAFARLFVTRVSDSALIHKDVTANSFFNLSDLHLEPLSWYKVRVHVVRGYDQPENPDVYQELTWRTNFDDVQAPTVVDVTDSTARIIQNVNYTGYDGQIFVFFILRELWSNKSLGLVATNITEIQHELDVKNLKPNALYKVYTLVTIMEFDRTATLDSSPILFKTKCLDKPYFEVSPGEENLTISMPSRPQDCKHPSNRLHSIKVYDTAENWLESSLGVTSFPVLILDLNPDTEYKVEIWIRRLKVRQLVFTTKVRTSASKEPVEPVTVPKAQLVLESSTTSLEGPKAQ